MLPPGADPNAVQASYENGGELRCRSCALSPNATRCKCACAATCGVVYQDSHAASLLAVLVVKIPKTEEYKALQPKKVDIQ